MPIEPLPTDFEAGLERLADPATKNALPSDAELLELYLYGGQQEAMLALVQRFAPLVTSVIRRVVSHPQDAEDAFQATFLILIKSARSIRSRPSIAAWLYGVAYRTACRVRAKSRRHAQSLGEADMPTTGAEQNPVVELARQIELGNLDRELENLPQQLREPLTEHYIFGYSARQIADRMELSVSAVEGRLRRGRRLLRHRLALRGTSLSIVVTGAAWFRDHATTANACEQWTEHLLQSPIFDPDASPSLALSCDPYLAELVQGESTMHIAPLLKSAGFLGAAAAVTVSMSVLAVAMQIGPAPKPGRGAAQVERAEANSAEPPIAAAALDTRVPPNDRRNVDPFGAPAQASSPSTAAGRLLADPVADPVSDNAADTQPFGVGAAGGNPFGSGSSTTTFVRPSGESPNWLRAGDEDIVASEKTRDTLRQTVTLDYKGTPLRQVIEEFETNTGVPMVIHEPELANLSIDPDTPVTISVGELPLCEALELILKPLDLRYEVQPRHINISSSDDLQGVVRYYDLAYVLPTSSGVRDLVHLMESTFSDDVAANSIQVVGSLMVVKCPEKGHRDIEKLLARLAKVDPKNLRSSGFSTQPPAGIGGYGGGGGMMGGGGMGGGGMF